ncbi:response regulator [Massilia pseudoviolaceinigra]|uniref:response regulator n=1 Tax=Massilia pseudoviolaceinigra TaxID=3057165 RepID=UPI0027967229|nr:response regulator [Massilia sp. CCM 9206]MDQ1919472.1 response regulator [Massilia sp. CCM 9206]
MKALIVDDDVVSRIALMDLLSVYGIFDPVEAEDGAAAWSLMQEGLHPVICFCDVRMPRMSGIALLERMKGDPNLADVPFVLVSSASDRDTVLQAVTLGAVGYILKPLHAAEARAHLEKIFRITLDKLAEDPGTTMKRLNIGPDRLGAYLAAFGEQLLTGRADIVALLDAGEGADARLRIDSVHTGCMTLGLWHVASQLDTARRGLPDARNVAVVLAEVSESVRRQLIRLRAGAADGEGALA